MNDGSLNKGERRLRQIWQENDTSRRGLTMADLYKILRRNSLVQKLRRRAILCFILALSAVFMLLMLMPTNIFSFGLTIAYSVFMLINCGLSIYWWNRLGKIYQFMTIPLIDAQEKMENLDRLRRRIKWGGWILGAPVIVWMFIELLNNREPLLGAFVGLIVGGTVGLIWERLNRRQIKDIKNSFTEPET